MLSTDKRVDSFNSFVQKATDKYGDRFRYNIDSYINAKQPLSIYDTSTDREFFQSPSNHLRSYPKYLDDGKGPSKRLTPEEALERLRGWHPDLDYSPFVFSTTKDKVIVICPKHGEFSKRYSDFSEESGCPSCGKERGAREISLSKEEFLQRVTPIHPDYDFSDSEYINLTTPITYRVDGEEFTDTPNNLLKRMSKRELGVIDNLSITPSIVDSTLDDYISTFEDLLEEFGVEPNDYEIDKSIGSYTVSLYIESKKLAIDFHMAKYSHSSKSKYVNEKYSRFYVPPKYLYDKWSYLSNEGITLFTIFDFYWNVPEKKDVFISKIKHLLGLDRTVYARKCELDTSISYEEAEEFMKVNHLEGSGFKYKDSSIYGLRYQDELVMVAIVGNYYDQSNKTFVPKLHRICTLLGTTVVGGVSKLSKEISKVHGYFKYQITLMTGGSSLAFVDDFRYCGSRYFWVRPETLVYYHRNYCQKKALEKHFGEPLLEDDTESTYMERLGYLKVYDNGIAELNL